MENIAAPFGSIFDVMYMQYVTSFSHAKLVHCAVVAGRKLSIYISIKAWYKLYVYLYAAICTIYNHNNSGYSKYCSYYRYRLHIPTNCYYICLMAKFIANLLNLLHQIRQIGCVSWILFIANKMGFGCKIAFQLFDDCMVDPLKYWGTKYRLEGWSLWYSWGILKFYVKLRISCQCLNRNIV